MDASIGINALFFSHVGMLDSVIIACIPSPQAAISANNSTPPNIVQVLSRVSDLILRNQYTSITQSIMI